MKRKLIALIAALCLSLTPISALAEDADTAMVQPFEDGFALMLPEGWLSYPVGEEQAGAGLVYLLSDAAGAHFLCISSAPSELTDVAALAEAMQGYENVQTQTYGAEFVTYTEGDAFGAVTLLDGAAWSFLFTGADDEAFASLAEEILLSFAPVDAAKEAE